MITSKLQERLVKKLILLQKVPCTTINIWILKNLSIVVLHNLFQKMYSMLGLLWTVWEEAMKLENPIWKINLKQTPTEVQLLQVIITSTPVGGISIFVWALQQMDIHFLKSGSKTLLDLSDNKKMLCKTLYSH